MRIETRELEAEVRKLTFEKDIQKSGSVLRAGAVVKYAFIRDELVGRCTTRMACRLLEVSPSGYYQFLQALPTPHKERRLAIERAVVRIQTESRRIYGSPKITREFRKLGLAAHRNTVSRIMQSCEICMKVPSNNNSECARTCTVARSS